MHGALCHAQPGSLVNATGAQRRATRGRATARTCSTPEARLAGFDAHIHRMNDPGELERSFVLVGDGRMPVAADLNCAHPRDCRNVGGRESNRLPRLGAMSAIVPVSESLGSNTMPTLKRPVGSVVVERPSVAFPSSLYARQSVASRRNNERSIEGRTLGVDDAFG